ncbi:MAG: hemolysin family protein [Actinomycetota bacterium]|nr:hemolysin family protein [Actinomycetota bacterium]
MNESLGLLATVLLLAGNSFFVGAEFAIITARKDRLQGLADGGSSSARATLRAGEHLPLLIAGAQLGITLCSLGLGRLGEPAVAQLIERPFRLLGMPPELLDPVAFTLALGVVVTLHTVIGEMVPKNLAIAGPERVAVVLVPAHYAFCNLARPALGLFTVTATVLLKLVHVTPRTELDSAYTGSELAEMISDSRREGLLDEQESSRLTQTLGAGERTVADVVVPLDRVASLPVSPTVAEVTAAVAEFGASRFPLRERDGRMVGYLHVKDVLEVADDPTAVVPADRVRGLPEIPCDARLDAALAALRRSAAHLGRVVSGAGGETVGVVAMDDLVQYYVGAVRSGEAS